MKNKNVRYSILTLILVVLVLFIIFYKEFKTEKQQNNTENEISNEKSYYEKGLDAYNQKKYNLAIEFYEQIQPNDINYSEAQRNIKNIKEYLDGEEKRIILLNTRIFDFKKEYKNLLSSGLSRENILIKLKSDNFYYKRTDRKKTGGAYREIEYFEKYGYGITIEIGLSTDPGTIYWYSVDAYPY